MSAKMTSLYREQSETQSVWIFRETFAATGLTASGPNTVPFPSPLPTVPRRVFLTPVANGAAGALVSLDTSKGAADPTGSFAGGNLGVDATNVYLYIGAATQCEIIVDYSQS
jgi:hypothetical protein